MFIRTFRAVFLLESLKAITPYHSWACLCPVTLAKGHPGDPRKPLQTTNHKLKPPTYQVTLPWLRSGSNPADLPLHELELSKEVLALYTVGRIRPTRSPGLPCAEKHAPQQNI